MNKKDLQPQSVFSFFSEINNIPRPSKHEEKIIAFLQNFGKEHSLETITDDCGNVLIRKPATPGREDAPTLILQSHMDMVCDKLVDHEIDFFNDPIETYIDGDWMRAKGTTLGADDGIGCAMELALLASTDIKHGAIECLFTRDEETGLTGANNLSGDMLKGSMLLNLDSEDEGLFYVSCAGGKTTTASFLYQKEEPTSDLFFLRASIKGLTGGHSGDDINKKRANAAKILARFLYLESKKIPELRLAQLHSGKLHNAIPRDGYTVFAVPFADKETVRVDWNLYCANVEEEFHVTETNVQWHMESTAKENVIPVGKANRIISALQAVHNGVFCVVQDTILGDITETSSNLASVHTEESQCTIVCSQRSSVMSNLENMVNTVRSVFELAEADNIVHNDGYPAWKMNPNSHLRQVAQDQYRALFNADPTVIGIHAGLECGLFAERYPDMDMLSIGPTMRGVHSPDERLYIPSVEKVWRLVCAVAEAL